MKISNIFIILLFYLISNNLFSQNQNNYQYDNLNRLIKVSYSNGTVINYSYDQLGNRTVKEVTNCSSPAIPDTISGLVSVCQGQNAVTYTVPTITNATSYIWTLPSGATGTSTTNSITVNYGTSAVSGSITVKGTNTCGNGAISTLGITVNPLPASAGIISGTATVCQGQNAVTYTIPTITNATSYIWTLPSGATGTSTTNSITVNYDTSAVSGNITVKGTNTCGNGAISTLGITVNPLPASAGTISGTATVCQGQNAVTYTVPTITNATSYVWSLPSGATGTSTTNSITVSYGTSTASGNITVKGTNTCGNGAISTLPITVNALPAVAGSISGTATVCQGQNAVTYTVPTIANATSYVWTLPSGATGTSTTNSITVSYGTSTASGNITVKGTNTCGNGAISTLPITVNALPAVAGTISGTATVCQGQNAVTYTVPTIANATSYVWTLPNGATGTSSSSSITVNYGVSAVSGSITVKGANTCGDGAISSLLITVNTLPTAAGIVSGTFSLCQGTNGLTYSVPVISGANSYKWVVPTNTIIIGANNTNTITLDFGNTAQSGNISVKGQNQCGFGTQSLQYITVNPLPGTPTSMTGVDSVCQGSAGNTYSIANLSGTGTNGYVWTLPTGFTGTSTTNSITISIANNAVSDTLKVKGTNGCGSGQEFSKTIVVKPLPSNSVAIIGSATVCKGTTNIVYKVNPVANALSYIWTLPNGITGTSSIDSIVVAISSNAVAGPITVKGVNACGDGPGSTLSVTVKDIPDVAGFISGNSTVCQGQNNVTYFIPAILNATSYVWTLPSDATGTSNTNSITVNYGTNSSSENITVKGTNSCGDGTMASLPIIVNPLPAVAGQISGPNTVCQGATNLIFSVAPIQYADSYNWSFSGTGATIVGNDRIVTVNLSNTATSGEITVVGHNACGNGSYLYFNPVNILPSPVTPIITQNVDTLFSNALSGNQWYNLTSGVINNATATIYTPQQIGDYFVIATINGCSSDSSNIIHFYNSGINYISNNQDFKIYPNPFKNELIIDIKNNNYKINFEIINPIGQVIFKGDLIEKRTIQTSRFIPGIYLIKLENAKTIEFIKIIKE